MIASCNLSWCVDYPNSMYTSLMHSDHSGSGSLTVPADRLMPVHPDVRLKPLPFYDVLAELLKPSTLSECLPLSVVVSQPIITVCYLHQDVLWSCEFVHLLVLHHSWLCFVLCKYLKFRIESNSYFSIQFDSKWAQLFQIFEYLPSPISYLFNRMSPVFHLSNHA